MKRYFQRHPDMGSRTLDDAMVIFNPHTGVVYELNVVGTQVWELLNQRQTVEDIVSGICEEFWASSEEVTNDVREFLSTLIDKGLVICNSEEK